MMHEIWELKQKQALPLEAKVALSKQRIREWHRYHGGACYVSFSGGKDSTVLLHLVRSLYPDVPAVFSDTGLEFPEIRQFIKGVENVTWVKPDLTFRQVIEKHGYPIISKEQSEWIHRARCGNPQVYNKNILGIMPDGSKTRFHVSEKWHYLLDAPFLIGSGCCFEMKKKPLDNYVKETGRVPYIGTMASESMLRTQKWLETGCNSFDNKKPASKPLSFWLDEDIWQYIRENDLPYCSAYDMGYAGTGCIFCAYGCHLEKSPNRFQMLQRTHPKLWRYCMRDWEAGGLGMRRVLDYIGVPYEDFMI